MIQLGEVVYPNIGMNALQRAPDTWVETGITAIDDSWQWLDQAINQTTVIKATSGVWPMA